MIKFCNVKHRPPSAKKADFCGLRYCILVAGLSYLSTSCAYDAYLQVGVFAKLKNAQKLQTEVDRINHFPSIIKRTSEEADIKYVLLIEGFKNKAVATGLQASLKKSGYQSMLKSLSKQQRLFAMMPYPALEEASVRQAYANLQKAKKNPEYLLDKQLSMPVSPELTHNKTYDMSIRDAILLSLRYSPDLLSTELDRIVSRYQLRVNENEFELRYALSATTQFSWNKSQGVRQPLQNNYVATPSLSLKSNWGGTTTVTMNNTYGDDIYSPQLVLNYEQPLLRGMGPSVVEKSLRDQQDQEKINKLTLKDTYINKVTAVISAYRNLISQKNAYETQQRSLKDAKYTYWVNKKRIEAGELEPSGNIQQEYQVSNLAVTLESQRNQLEQSKRSLLQLIGLDPTLRIKVPSNIHVPRMKAPDLNTSIEYAYKNNIAYQNVLVNYRITKRALVAAQNDQLWELNLTATQSYGTSSATAQDSGFQNITNGRNQASQVGLRLNVPINDLPRRSTLISAKVSLEKARLNLVAQKRQLETDVINKIVNIKTQINLYRMHIKQLALAQRSYDIEVKKRKAGISSALDVTNTQNQLIDARNSLISAKISYLEGVSSLEQLLGTTLEVWKIKMRFI